jgi:formylglycine-generating enzyme
VRRVPAALIALSALALASPVLAQEKALSIDLGQGVRLDLVLVPAGSFDQGSPPTEAGHVDDETLHPVTLSRAFYMGKVPVTRGQFARFAGDAGYRTEAERGVSGGSGFDGRALVQRKEFTWKTPGFPQTDDHPVTLVTYDDALAFAGWVGKRSGRAVSLPTEAQWEYAGRAGARTRFYTGEGDESAALIGWFKDNAGNGTRPVGQKKPNAFGLHDMGGDVFEWCRDWYAPYPRGAATDPEQTAQVNDGDKPRRVLRGGSWLKDRKNLRSAARARQAPGSRNADNGFRIVASVEAAQVVPPAPVAKSSPAPSDTQPPPHDGDAASRDTATGWCWGVGLFGFLGLASWVVLTMRRGARRRSAEGISVKPAGDGFWLKVPSRLDGAQVSYRCQVGSGTRRETVTAEISDRGQFVYTGGVPRDVQIESVVARASSSGLVRYRAPSVSPPVVHHPHHHEDTSTPFHGYPSAY